MCFFIDGLDEYDGDHEEITNVLRGISSGTSNIKICVSSRPWIVFNEAFNGVPMLRLQDLTFHDIDAYVFDKLQGHDKMRILKEAEPEHAAELVNEVVMRASGVFLWVALVVKSLLNGLRNRDTIEDLRTQLSELPSDLDAFYTHMLKHVEPLYREQAARAFQIFEILVTAPRDFNATALQFELALESRPHATPLDSLEPIGHREIASRIQRLDIFLKSRCGGLLEISDSNTPSGSLDGILSLAKVQFLHRTVREFLETDSAKSLISDAIISPDFRPDRLIAMSHVTMLKRSIFKEQMGLRVWKGYSNFNIWESIIDVMEIARSLEVTAKFGYSSVIDELYHVGMRKWRMDEQPSQRTFHELFYMDPGESWMTCDRPRRWQRNFLGLAIHRGLYSYVESKVKADSSLVLGGYETPLLQYTVIPESGDSLPLWSSEMAKLLLKYGADPNQLWHGNSPWQIALTHIHRHGKANVAALFKTMITYKTSPFTTCINNHHIPSRSKHCQQDAPHSVEAVLEDVSRYIAPSKTAELRYLLRHQISSRQPSSDCIKSKDNDTERRPKRRLDENISCEPRKHWRR